MKTLLVLISFLSQASMIHAQEPASTYVSEAPLPKGWQTPSNYGKVIEKNYPASRVAVTKSFFQNIAFLTLFRHIKKEGIPMTSPVAMDLNAGDQTKKENMAFLYQDTKVGKLGTSGKNVEVKDLPAMRVLSYAWHGDGSNKNILAAKAAIEKTLQEKHLTISHYRVLGYNSPSMPDDKATWELQAILKK